MAFRTTSMVLSARADMAAQVRTAVDRRAIAARNLVLVTKPADLEIEKADVMRASEDVQAKLKLLKTMVASGPGSSDTARSLVGEIDRVETLYGPVANDIVALALAGKHDEAIVKMDDECRPLLAALVKATDAYADFTRNRQEQLVRDAEDQYQDAAQPADRAFAWPRSPWHSAAGVFITRSITRADPACRRCRQHGGARRSSQPHRGDAERRNRPVARRARRHERAADRNGEPRA